MITSWAPTAGATTAVISKRRGSLHSDFLTSSMKHANRLGDDMEERSMLNCWSRMEASVRSIMMPNRHSIQFVVVRPKCPCGKVSSFAPIAWMQRGAGIMPIGAP